MKNNYEVYPDKIRTYTTATIFLAFALCLFAIVLVKTWLFLKILVVFFGILFAYLAYKTFRDGHLDHPDYLINDQGVTDNTKVKSVTVSWHDILKIEMTPNNAVMQIGILAKSTVSDEDEKSAVLRDNLANNGNLAFYSIMIDGFRYRQKPFLKIFKELERQGVEHNPQILISEYIDPETKRKMADKRDDEIRAARKQRRLAQQLNNPKRHWWQRG
ncbi:hypothetical protein [Paucilactobacillus wasatchensis]|uniref:Uncharacterized protein n=1 Tax=Paucilactobacillus wasatchensis TaxID=1335616 RepID=A0A0D1A4R4_9LACO|nr:hypothetical protein [Paucilactobacillus wasatchensis]KIS02692.1 hypothetical protein WDC_1735 [Paucilactobacillus wasatchensis]